MLSGGRTNKLLPYPPTLDIRSLPTLLVNLLASSQAPWSFEPLVVELFPTGRLFRTSESVCSPRLLVAKQPVPTPAVLNELGRKPSPNPTDGIWNSVPHPLCSVTSFPFNRN
jgi:hypothetical protein